MNNYLKDEIEGMKDMIDDTLANPDLDIEEKIKFCESIIKYLHAEKQGLIDFIEENI